MAQCLTASPVNKVALVHGDVIMSVSFTDFAFGLLAEYFVSLILP